MITKNLYAERDIINLGKLYTEHVSHMTSEDLHSKSAIAAELAFRDNEIAKLKAKLSVRDSEPIEYTALEASLNRSLAGYTDKLSLALRFKDLNGYKQVTACLLQGDELYTSPHTLSSKKTWYSALHTADESFEAWLAELYADGGLQ